MKGGELMTIEKIAKFQKNDKNLVKNILYLHFIQKKNANEISKEIKVYYKKVKTIIDFAKEF